MSIGKYKLKFTDAAKEDQTNLKRYILKQFKYKEYGENFDAKMRSAYETVKNVNKSIDPIKIIYRGYNIFLLSHKTYLFFYIVDEDRRVITILRVMQDGMNWMPHIMKWIGQNERQSNDPTENKRN